jgi:hypothetical protein
LTGYRQCSQWTSQLRSEKFIQKIPHK